VSNLFCVYLIRKHTIRVGAIGIKMFVRVRVGVHKLGKFSLRYCSGSCIGGGSRHTTALFWL